MNQKYSDLQLKYPLSPKKYWKKMIEKLLALYALSGILAIVLAIVLFMASGERNRDVFTILMIVLIVGILLVAIITGFVSWYIKVYIREYYYDAGKDFITIKKGVFAPTEIHVQWQKIQDVYVDQDIFDRFMGLYDVHIASATASSGIEAHIDGVDHASAEALKELLLARVSNREWSNTSSDSQSNTVASTNTEIQNRTIDFSEEISSEKYPILGKWVVVSMWSRIVSWLFFWIVIVLILSGKTMSIAEKGLQDIKTTFIIYLCLGIVSIIFSIIALFLWRRNYSFKFNPENIYYKTGILSISEKHMPYSTIQDVTVSQSFLERIFGLGKVNIENATQTAVVQQSKWSGSFNSRGSNLPAFNGIQIVGITLENAQHITKILKDTVLGKGTERHGL
jgi:membrane protein YdbS with pleckstrin-like domain